MVNWDFAMEVKAIQFFSRISAAEQISARRFRQEQLRTATPTERQMTEATLFITGQTQIQTGMMRQIILQTMKLTELTANH